MVRCPHCDGELENLSRSCPHCGKELPAEVEGTASEVEYVIEPASASQTGDSLLSFFRSMQGVDHGDSVVVEPESSTGERADEVLASPEPEHPRSEPPSAIEAIAAMREGEAAPSADRVQEDAGAEEGLVTPAAADEEPAAVAHCEARADDAEPSGVPVEAPVAVPDPSEADAVAEPPAGPTELPWQAAHGASEPDRFRSRHRKQSSTSLVAIIATYLCGAMTGFVIGKLVYGPAATSPLRKIPDYGVHRGGREWTLPDPNAAVPRGHWLEPGDHVQIGDLEIEVVELGVRPVRLVRLDPISGQVERRETGTESLVLVLRLRNRSDRLAFVPIDEMFLRDSDFPQYSYIEFPDGSRVGMYPLPQFSEFNLENQSFEELPPGGEQTYWIVAHPDAVEKIRNTMTWRVQLRAGGTVDQTYSTVIAIRFHAEDVKRTGSRPTT